MEHLGRELTEREMEELDLETRGFWDKIKAGWNKVKEGAKNLWDQHKDKVIDYAKQSLGRELTEQEEHHLERRFNELDERGFWDAIKSGWSKVKEGAKNLWNTHKDTVMNGLGNLAKEHLGRELTEREMEDLDLEARGDKWDKIKLKFSQVKDLGKWLWENRDVIKDYYKDKLGRELTEREVEELGARGWWSSLKDKVKAGWDKVKGAAGALWDQHKDAIIDAAKNHIGRELTEKEMQMLERSFNEE